MNNSIMKMDTARNIPIGCVKDLDEILDKVRLRRFGKKFTLTIIYQKANINQCVLIEDKEPIFCIEHIKPIVLKLIEDKEVNDSLRESLMQYASKYRFLVK